MITVKLLSYPVGVQQAVDQLTGGWFSHIASEKISSDLFPENPDEALDSVRYVFEIEGLNEALLWFLSHNNVSTLQFGDMGYTDKLDPDSIPRLFNDEEVQRLAYDAYADASAYQSKIIDEEGEPTPDIMPRICSRNLTVSLSLRKIYYMRQQLYCYERINGAEALTKELVNKIVEVSPYMAKFLNKDWE